MAGKLPLNLFGGGGGRVDTQLSNSAAHKSTQSTVSDGALIKDVALTTTTSRVAHKLGRAVQGWAVVSIDAAEVVYQDGEADNTFIPLRLGSGTATVSLWVF